MPKGFACGGILCLWLAVSFAAAATPQEIDNAIRDGVACLKNQQHDGNWERDLGPHGVDDDQYTGRTAMAAWALLAAGEKPNEPHVAAALAWLRKTPTNGVYALGLRAQVWAAVAPSKENRPVMMADTKALNQAMRTAGDASGMYHYTIGRGNSYDHSCSQFGILGFWALSHSSMEIDGRVWRMADASWRKHQSADGGWNYMSGFGGSTLSMTAAGVASLYITQEYVRNAAGCSGNVTDENIERGIKWIGQNLEQPRPAPRRFGGFDPFGGARNRDVGFDPHWLYTQFGLSRIGIISGRKYFGDHDWFAEGAESIVTRQKPDGSWGGVDETAFAMLFLTRGSAPVLIQKLQYKADLNGKLVEGPWQQRPRDVGNLVAWMGRQQERNFNWQTTPLDVPVVNLHDAPILYIGGNLAPSFSPEEVAKLKQFVQEGGLILGHADCGAEVFTNAFKKLGVEMFPESEFRELPRDHAIYTSETIQYQPSKWPQRPSVMGISNGVRELMLLIPAADAAKAWQMNDDKSKAEMFQLAANIVLYATDNRPVTKGNTYLVKADANREMSRTIKLARLSYAGNWNPEPAGWTRLAAIMRSRAKTELVVEPVKLGEGKLANYNAAHLTGTTAITVTDAMRNELKTFIANGGTLVIDAAGGSQAFALAIEDELGKLFPAGSAKLYSPLPKDDPVYVQALGAAPEITFRFWARTKFALRTEQAQIHAYEQKGRKVVFFSPQDLSGGLVGQNMDGINGYSPATSAELMQAMLLYSVGARR